MTPEFRPRERPAAGRRARRRPLGRVSIALGLTVFISLVGTTFATATWTAPASTLTGTAMSATPLVKFTQTAALTTEYKFAVGSASPSVVKPLVVENAGTTPLDYTLTITGVSPNDLAPKVVLSLWKSAGATCAATIPSVGTAVGQATVNRLNVAPVLPAGTTSAPRGTTFTLCAATSLTGTVAASQGLTVTPVLTMTGRVGTNWSSAVVAPAFTQNVYRVGDPGNVTCTTKDPTLSSAGTATLTWAAAAGTAVNYRIVRVADGATWSNLTTAGATLTYNDVTSTAFLVQSTETAFGTTSIGVPVTVSRSSGLQGLFASAYCGT